MNKAAIAVLSVGAFCTCSQNALAQPDTSSKRSLAMVGLTVPVTPHVVSGKKPVPTKAVSKRLLQQKAKNAYPHTHLEKGQYYKSKGNNDLALVEFLKASQENPRLVRAFYEQALIFHQKGFLKLAESSLEQALAVKPDYNDARILLATIRIQQGNAIGAMQELSRSLGINLGNPAATTSNTKPLPAASTHSKPAKGPSHEAAVLQSLHAVLAEVPTMVTPPQVKKQQVETAPVERAESETRHEGLTIDPKTPPSHQPMDETPPKIDENNAPESQKANAKDNDVLVLRIPKSLNFFRHKQDQPDEDRKNSSGKSDKPIAEKAKHSGEAKASQIKTAEQSAKNGPQHSWLSRLWHQDDAPQQPVKAPISGGNVVITHIDPMEATGMHNTAETTTKQKPSPAQPPRREHEDSDAAQNQSAKVAQAEEPEVQLTKARVALKFEPAERSEAPQSDAPHFKAQSINPDKSHLLASLNTSDRRPAQKPAPLSEDDWTKRLKYLEEHGTDSLKDGEAFMFAEDTGEATLFLADGQTIKRKIAEARDAQEVVRERRPDILIPDDLVYNLSLLGKLMPKPDNPPIQNSVSSQNDAQLTTDAAQPKQNFNVDNLLGESQGFWGWLKNVFKF